MQNWEPTRDISNGPQNPMNFESAGKWGGGQNTIYYFSVGGGRGIMGRWWRFVLLRGRLLNKVEVWGN